MNKSLQILAAVTSIIIIYLITLYVLHSDGLITTLDIKVERNESILLINGYASPGQIAKKHFNTINAYTDNFKKIPRSLDSGGGASMTYQFWIKINDTDESKYRDLIILLKGDNREFVSGHYDKNGALTHQDPPQRTIKSPLIKFGHSYKNIVIETNTNNVVNYRADVDMNPESTSMSRRNLLSLLPINWFLFTFVFEDNYSVTDSTENGIKITFYVNDFPYQINSASSDPLLRNNWLVQNDGELYLMPNLNQSGDFLSIANLTYYNSAQTPDQIRKVFNAGAPTNQYSETPQLTNKPAFINAMNKLDIYNY